MKTHRINLFNVIMPAAILACILSSCKMSGQSKTESADLPSELISSSANTSSEQVQSNSYETVSTDVTANKATLASSEAAPEIPPAIELFGNTGTALIKKYGKCKEETGNGWTMLFDTMPYMITLDTWERNGKVSCVELAGDNNVKGGSFTNKIQIGMTLDQIKKAINEPNLDISKSLDGAEGIVEGTAYIGFIDTSGYTINAYFSKSNVLIGGLMKLSEEPQSDPYQTNSVASTASATNDKYVITDDVAQYVEAHRRFDPSDLLHSVNAEEYGKIDGMYDSGILKVSSTGGYWTVLTWSEYLNRNPDAEMGYYSALLKHFGVYSQQQFYMNKKYSLALK